MGRRYSGQVGDEGIVRGKRRDRPATTTWNQGCVTVCIYIVRYAWDERKNQLNQRKHGISFELAALAFEDPQCLIAFDREDEDGEFRWHAIGAVSIEPDIGAIFLIAHVYREDRDGEEVIRIISARAAETDEIRRYQEQEVE